MWSNNVNINLHCRRKGNYHHISSGLSSLLLIDHVSLFDIEFPEMEPESEMQSEPEPEMQKK